MIAYLSTPVKRKKERQANKLEVGELSFSATKSIRKKCRRWGLEIIKNEKVNVKSPLPAGYRKSTAVGFLG